jgi:glycosyltransferase involved in cell wall biosynthesis
MRVVFAGESGDFDGFSPSSQPLDGPEKALANLATALAMRGHEVSVFNGRTTPVMAHDVSWHDAAAEPPAAVDLLVAFRAPGRLDVAPEAKRRVLWLCGPASSGVLVHEAVPRHRPTVVLSSRGQRDALANAAALDLTVIEPGIAAAYLEDAPMAPADPPRAVATAHPQAGLDWLMKLWVDRIRPQVANAELHVYSAWLDQGRDGVMVPAAIKPVVDQAIAAAEHGVVIERPQADPAMVDAYRHARVHLHPAASSDVYGFALAESQALGLPAVVRASNGVMVERIADGQTGVIAAVIAAGDANFAHAAIDLLTDGSRFDRMSANARALKRGRSWAVAAADWEDRFG